MDDQNLLTGSDETDNSNQNQNEDDVDYLPTIPQESYQDYEKMVLKISELDLKDMRSFIMRPAIKGRVMQVTLIRDRSGIKKKFFPKFLVVFSENINHHILSAQKKAHNKSSNIVLSLSQQDFSRKSENCLGKLRSNFVGTQFHLYDNGENPKSKKVGREIRKEFSFVEYEKNIMGFKGP